MSQDDSRSDAVLRHFSSRSRQPKVLAEGPAANGSAPKPQNANLIFEQGFGGISDQVDDNRFKYIGTTPQLSQLNKNNSRRIRQDVLKEGFSW